MKLIYNVKDRPSFSNTVLFALQQLLAIMAATIAVPAIVGNGMSPAAALFGAGIGTLVYLCFTKFKSPVFLGSSFAFLGSMGAAFAGGVSAGLGYFGLILGAVFAGLVYVVIAIVVRFAGVKWIAKIMPAVIIGPTVAIIGLSLAGNAIGDIVKTNRVIVEDNKNYDIVEIVNKVKNDNNEIVDDVSYAVYPKGEEQEAYNLRSDLSVSVDDEGNKTVTRVPDTTYASLICGLLTLAVTVICSVYGKKMAKMIPFIIGIASGFALAAIFTLIGIGTGIEGLLICDFSKLAPSAWQWYPDFTFITAIKGTSEITGAYIAKIAVAYIPVAFVVFAEHIADHKNISSIIETDLLEDPGLHRTLLGDGVGSMAGAFFGGCPNTTYGESIGCVAISGNASVVTIFATAILAIISSFIAPFSAFLASIPSCVMGGVCVALYGFIAVSGLKMLQSVDLGDNKNLFPASVILISGIGGLTLTFGKITITSIACALILGILTNVLVGNKEEK